MFSVKYDLTFYRAHGNDYPDLYRKVINKNDAGIVVENGNDQAFKEAATNFLDVKVRKMKSEGSKSLVNKIFGFSAVLRSFCMTESIFLNR